LWFQKIPKAGSWSDSPYIFSLTFHFDYLHFWSSSVFSHLISSPFNALLSRYAYKQKGSDFGLKVISCKKAMSCILVWTKEISSPSMKTEEIKILPDRLKFERIAGDFDFFLSLRSFPAYLFKSGGKSRIWHEINWIHSKCPLTWLYHLSNIWNCEQFDAGRVFDSRSGCFFLVARRLISWLLLTCFTSRSLLSDQSVVRVFWSSLVQKMTRRSAARHEHEVLDRGFVSKFVWCFQFRDENTNRWSG
jgi:hypothetical protein